METFRSAKAWDSYSVLALLEIVEVFDAPVDGLNFARATVMVALSKERNPRSASGYAGADFERLRSFYAALREVCVLSLLTCCQQDVRPLAKDDFFRLLCFDGVHMHPFEINLKMLN
jgi:hypothetical protein